MEVQGVAAVAAATETLATPATAAEVAGLGGEVLSQGLPGRQLASLPVEVLSGLRPPTWAPTVVVEVLRRDTAASAMVSTGMEVFGDQAWPSAKRGVFAFRHDWAEPLVERIEWQTSIARLSSGNESRHAVRWVPRRHLTYQVGHARATDALVLDWLADHLGKRALWPLPQFAVRLRQAASRGARVIDVDPFQWSAAGPAEAELSLDESGLRGWPDETRHLLIDAADGWQLAECSRRELSNGALVLIEPLARSAAVGSAVIPLLWGTAVDPSSMNQWVPGVTGGSVTASLAPQSPPAALDTNEPRLDGIEVWPDGNWRDDPLASVEGSIALQDLSPADPWVQRRDPWALTTYQRRHLLSGSAQIEAWRSRLWRTQGRLQSFWLPDGLAPVLWVMQQASPDDGFLRVRMPDPDHGDARAMSAFWHRPAACVIAHPNGAQQYALTGASFLDSQSGALVGVLVLRSGLDRPVPKGSRILRLARCRLDHDAVDLYWHHPSLVEMTLTARQLPEPRGNNRLTYRPG